MADTKISALTTMTGDEVGAGDKLVILDNDVTTTKAITKNEFYKSASDILIRGVSPELHIRETDGTAGYDGVRLSRRSNVTYLETMNDETVVSVEYQLTVNASGATLHQWFIAGAEALRLDSAGFLGIGVTGPLAQADVDGNLIVRGVVFREQTAHITKAAAATLTAAELLNGTIQYTGAAANLTMPTATDIVAGLPASMINQQSFDFSIINTGSGTSTVVTNTGLTPIGALTIAAGTSGWFRVRKTTATTVTFLRMG